MKHKFRIVPPMPDKGFAGLTEIHANGRHYSVCSTGPKAEEALRERVREIAKAC